MKATARSQAAILTLSLLLQAPVDGVAQEDSKAKPNRLIQENSPYLRQHAYNPVDWYPWGEEAFAKARRELKPIFLSVGYSTCHWCHVMERESFSNPGIAAQMNRDFVCIKVDREERPDIDRVYMTFVQASTGHGGWPMSVFLTPDLKPFFGGTYFPADKSRGTTTFPQVLERVHHEWTNNREKILSAADRIAEALQQMAQASGDASAVEKDLLERSFQIFAASFDSQEGGFGRAPKFPRPVIFNFLLRYFARTGEEKALQMTLETLKAMARGGIHDQLGGGFHRYSTDSRWFLPHFEKMLYDQAQLASSFLEAYQISGDAELARTARGILDYVLREMTGPEGGFYSAEDADSPLPENIREHSEGAFYVWRRSEVFEALEDLAVPGLDQAAAAEIFAFYFGVKAQGNVEADPFGEFRNKNVLYQAADLTETARKFDQTSQAAAQILEAAKNRLFEVRRHRPRPPLDDKLLTAWNGLMISAFARGYQVLGEKRYLEAARRSADLIRGKLYQPSDGGLKRRYRLGEAGVRGMLSDYAFLVQGLLDLYESDLNEEWLKWAIDLNEAQIRLFYDADQGGFFNTIAGDAAVLFRIKEDYDGAEPSPNSIAVLNLLRLAQLTGRKDWGRSAEKTIQAFLGSLKQTPSGLPQMMAGVDFHLSKPLQFIIAGERGSPGTLAMLQEIHRRFLPVKVIFLADGGALQKTLQERLPELEGMRPKGGKATAYICRNYVCDLPANDLATVRKLLDAALR